MRILHINSYYLPGKFYKNLYDKQIQNGLDIDVYVPATFSAIKDEFDYGKYTTISRNHGKYDRYIFHLKHYKIYKDIIKKYDIKNYSIIHAHSLFSNGYIAMKLKQNYGVPYIVAVRNTDVNVFFHRMPHLRRTGIKILEEANAVVFLSKVYRDTTIERYVPQAIREVIYKKTSIIPNGIDDFWFKNIGTVKKAPEKNNVKLLYVGSINKNKNILTTIKAIKLLQRKDYIISYTLVGNIQDKNIYGEIKAHEFIRYIPYKPKEELVRIYRENDIFVMPSITETFGLVYPEAMSQGLPVIYTRGQGFDGQFEDGTVGYSVNCFDAEEIADRIISIMNRYKEQSKNCIKLCDKFDWSLIAKDHKNIYKLI